MNHVWMRSRSKTCIESLFFKWIRKHRPRLNFFYHPTFEGLEDRTVPSVVVGGDFNGDGFGDLAIGAPDEDVAGIIDAGAVNVIYGSANGTTTLKNQIWNQDSTGIKQIAGEGDQFGFSLAAGDFNGDGFDDLAIGVPNEDFTSGGGATNAGGVHVIYGSAQGLTKLNNQFWSQDAPQTLHGTSTAEFFGRSLAVGDFNGDGFDDLACGVPGNNGGKNTDATQSVEFAGLAHIFFGTSTGLTAVAPNDQCFELASYRMRGDARERDRMGWSVAAGDFNGDGFDDLAIGIPQRDAGPNGEITDAGAVTVVYGSAEGLKSTTGPGNQLFYQGNSGVVDRFTYDLGDQAEAFDRFGETLAAGDLNNDGFDELIIGIPFEDLLVEGIDRVDAGAAAVVFGSSHGLTVAGNQMWHQGGAGVGDAAEDLDHFGRGLTVADFNGDGFADLAVGIPGEDVLTEAGDLAGAGAVAVIYGSATGLTGAGSQFWIQGQAGLGETAEAGDAFGQAVGAGDFNGDGIADLTVSAPVEDLDAFADAGVVHILYGSTTNLTANGSQLWSQDSVDSFGDILDQVESGDNFGIGLVD